MRTRTITAGRLGVAGLALAVLAATAAPAAATPGPASGPATTLLSISLDGDGTLSVTGDASRPAGGGTTGAVPDLPAYAFLGEAGTAVWALAPAAGALPAWDTTGVPLSAVRGDVTVELRDVDGPGAWHAYTVSPVGKPRPLLGSPAGAPGQTSLPAGSAHGGLVWAFDAPGTYRLTLAASVPLAGGGTAAGETTMHVDVPAFAPTTTPAATAGRAGEAATTGHGELANRVAVRPLAQDGTGGTGGEQVVIGDGHVDIGPRFVDGAWTIQIKDDTVRPAEWRDPADVVLQVVEDAAMDVPEGEFDFLGSPGDTVWVLPQAQQAGILWPGWNTEHESVVDGVNGDVTWRLREVTGPGEFVLFLTGSFGQSQVRFHSGETLPQEMAIPLRTHSHGNWAFTRPGIYHLDVEMSATTTSGEEVTDTGTLAFAVGDADPHDAFPGDHPDGPGDGDGDGGDGPGDGDGDGSMPRTGLTGLPVLLALGAALVLGGAVLLATVARRRSRAASGRSS